MRRLPLLIHVIDLYINGVSAKLCKAREREGERERGREGERENKLSSYLSMDVGTHCLTT